jgi:flagellar protein FliO/FliZ
VVESGIAVERPGIGASARRAAPASPVAVAPSQPVTDALEAAQHLVPSPPPQAGPMERLRDLARPVPQRPGSLRHTGLMRPISRMEPAAVIPINPDNLDHRRVDSAKTGPANDLSGQAKLGAGTYLGDGFKAEGS